MSRLKRRLRTLLTAYTRRCSWSASRSASIMSDRSRASDGKAGHVRNNAVIAAPVRATTVERAYGPG